MHDRVALELAKLVAAEFASRPRCIEIVRENLYRRRERNAGSESLVRCYDKWLALLDKPVGDLCHAMLAMTPDGQRLRQSSPFAGISPTCVVWDAKRKARDGQAAA